MENVKIFSGNSNRPLARAICAELFKELSDAFVGRFNDGEVRVQIGENIRNRTVFIVQSTNPPAENWDELYFLIDASRRGSAHEITAVCPYFGYARQERKDASRVPISMKVKMEHVVVSGACRILTMDLHTGASQGFVDVPVDHLYAPPLLLNSMTHLFTPELRRDIVIASDLGFSKVASHYARILGCDYIPCRKRREVNVVHEVEIIGQVKDKLVFYMDDMIDTGGTIARIAAELKNQEAREIHVAVTHAVLGKGWDDLQNGLLGAPLTSIVFTDTIQPVEEKMNKLREKMEVRIVSVAEMFAQAIQEIAIGGSIGRIFEEWEDKLQQIGQK